MWELSNLCLMSHGFFVLSLRCIWLWWVHKMHVFVFLIQSIEMKLLGIAGLKTKIEKKKKAPIRQSLAHFTWCIWVLMLIDVHCFFLTKNHPFSCCTNSDVTRACRHLYWALRQNLPISAGIQVEEVQIKTKVIGEGFFFRKSHPFKLLQHLSLYNLKIWVSVPILKWRKKLTW